MTCLWNNVYNQIGLVVMSVKFKTQFSQICIKKISFCLHISVIHFFLSHILSKLKSLQY